MNGSDLAGSDGFSGLEWTISCARTDDGLAEWIISCAVNNRSNGPGLDHGQDHVGRDHEGQA